MLRLNVKIANKMQIHKIKALYMEFYLYICRQKEL